jgi:hypothetical protein
LAYGTSSQAHLSTQSTELQQEEWALPAGVKGVVEILLAGFLHWVRGLKEMTSGFWV